MRRQISIWAEVTVYFMLAMLIMIFAFSGCAQRLTNDQWVERYKPETIEQAEAMAVLQTSLTAAEAKAKSLAIMDKFKIACGIGAVASVAAIVIASALGIKILTIIGGAGLAASLAGFSLAYAGIEFAKLVAIGGLVIGTVGGGYAVYITIRALKQIVKGGEKLKAELSDDARVDFKAAHKETQKHKTTTKIVDKIRNGL